MCCGAALSLSHTEITEEFHFKMNKGLQDLGFYYRTKKSIGCSAADAGCTDVHQNYHYWDSVFCSRLHFPS